MGSRILTVSGLYPSPSSKGPVPAVRIQGKWLEALDFRIGDKVEIYGDKQAVIITPAKEAAERTAFRNATLEKDISDARHELNRLVEIRDALSELILAVSQRLDQLIVEQIGNTEGKED